MSDTQTQWVSLRSDDLAVDIDPLGAQLSAVRDRAGRDLLWNGDPAVWSGRAPLLFPIVGELAGGHYSLGTRSYPLSRHGFARGKRFEVMQASATNAVFRLSADESTLRVYPFRFELRVEFDLQKSTLSITTHVKNHGKADMPASVGYHPAFRWPLPYGQERAEHFIEFASNEPGSMRRLNAQGLLTAELHPTPIVQRRLALDDAWFRDDVMIFDQIRSRSLSYGAGSGPRVIISYPDSAYLGVWSKPGAPFVCIEPWRGVADPAGFSRDFGGKPGVFMVAPGAFVPIHMSITLAES